MTAHDSRRTGPKLRVSSAEVIRLGKDVCKTLMDPSGFAALHGRIRPEHILNNGQYNYRIKKRRRHEDSRTSDFRAPEQKKGLPGDIRSDIYSLGALMGWMLNGQMIPKQDPAWGSEELKMILRRTRKTLAEERYQTPEELLAALEACPVDPQELLLEKPRRKRGLVAAALAVALAAVLFFLMIPKFQYTLMSDVCLSDTADPYVFDSGYRRDQIRSITFLRTLKDAPENAWDVSEDRSGTVLAWVVPNGSRFDLFIGAEGGVLAPADCRTLFSEYSNLESIAFNKAFSTSNTITMSKMFSGCGSLEALDLSELDSSNVTHMGAMFFECDSLTELDLSGLDTGSVMDMGLMFSGCSSLTELDLSGFDTFNVTFMHSMFQGCSSLTMLDLSGFNTSNVTDMGLMFSGCSSLTELDLSGFVTFNVTHMGTMFSECRSLTALDLSGFDTSNVTNMCYMFQGCDSLTELDLSGFDTSHVTYMHYMFQECSSLESLDVSGFDTTDVRDMRCMFYKCYQLDDLDVSHFDISNVAAYKHFMDEGKTINGRPWAEFFD